MTSMVVILFAGRTLVGRCFWRLAALALAVVLISGCATTGGNSVRLTQPGAEAPGGWLVLSIAIQHKKGDFPIPFMSNTLYVSNAGRSESDSLQLFLPDFGKKRLAELDLVEDGLHVKVFAMRLAPGRYALTGGYMSSSSGTVSQWVSSDEGFSYEFEVLDGQVTYLGSFLGRTVGGKNRFGMDIRVGGYFEISNERERDLRLADGKVAADLSPLTVVESVPRFSEPAGGMFVTRR